MTNRRRKIPFDMKGWAAEIEQLPLDEINNLRLEIGREHQQHIAAASLTRGKLDVLRGIMFVRKNGGDIGISDHAVLRYMERHKGIDIRAIRQELAAIAKARKGKADERGRFDVDGVSFVLPEGNNVVATVLPLADSDQMTKRS